MATENETLIDNFIDRLWMERGLSHNTLASYRSDLALFVRWLSDRNSSLLQADRSDIHAYLAQRVAENTRPRSTARLLSSLRQLFRFMCREGLREDDPSALIESPRLGQNLPKSLSRVAFTGPRYRYRSGPERPGHAGIDVCLWSAGF